MGQGAFGQYVSINLGFGLGVAMGIHVGGKVSGTTNKCVTPENLQKPPDLVFASPQEPT